jgi:hypothetical protein
MGYLSRCDFGNRPGIILTEDIGYCHRTDSSKSRTRSGIKAFPHHAKRKNGIRDKLHGDTVYSIQALTGPHPALLYAFTLKR